MVWDAEEVEVGTVWCGNHRQVPIVRDIDISMTRYHVDVTTASW